MLRHITTSDMNISIMAISSVVVNGKHIDYDDKIRYIRRTQMVTDEAWQARAKQLLKSELKKRGLSYKQLAELLTKIGVPETEATIANKISRGGFSAVFLIQCLDTIDCKNFRLD